MGVLGPPRYERRVGGLAFPREFAGGGGAGGPASLARHCADSAAVGGAASEEARFPPGLRPGEGASAASGCCLRLRLVVRVARQLRRGVKLAGVLLAGDGGSVPASLATDAPARPGWPGAGWLTVDGGWFAPPAEILAFG
jgi:hypothetical protein